MKNKLFTEVAVKTATYFFVFGFFWILLSDNILHFVFNDYELESKLQTPKGWLFILITSIFIYHVVKQQFKTIVELNSKLKTSEINLSAILENIGEGIIRTDSEGVITEINNVAKRLTGFQESEALGKSIDQVFIIVNDQEEVSSNPLGFSNNGQKQFSKTVRLISKQKKEYIVLNRIDHLVDDKGKVTGTIVAFKDVTQENEKNKALIESESRLRALLEASHDLIWMCNPDGVITFINDASRKLYKLSPEEMIGRPFSDFIQQSLLDHHSQSFADNLQKGKMISEYEGEIINKEGEVLFVNDNVVAIMDENRNLKAILGATKDMTGKKMAEKELLEGKERLELALAAGDLATWDFVLTGQNMIVNDLYKEMLGLQMQGNVLPIESFFQLIHSDDIQLINNSLQQAFGFEKEKFNIEFRMKHADGSVRWIHSMGKVAERDDQKRVVRLIGTNQDITVRKNLEFELQRWIKIYQSFIKYSGEGIYLYELEKPMPLELPVDEKINHFYHLGRIAICNDSFAKMYGYNHSTEIEGVDLMTLHGGDNKPENIAFLKKFINANYRVMHEISKESDKSGKTIYISNNAVGIVENKQLLRVWGSQLDITDQVEAHHKLESTMVFYRLLFETNPVPLIIFDIDDFHIYDVNKSTEDLFGFTHDQMLQMNLRDIRPGVSMYSDLELFDLISNELSKNTEYQLIKKSGKPIQVEVKSDQIDYGEKRAVLAAINDVTSLREAEMKVLQSLIEGEDNERRRVAKELHDSLGQSLTAASLNFDSIGNNLSLLDPARADNFKTGMTFLNLAIEESRNIAHNLMPKAIEDFGLVLSLKSLFNYIEKTSGIEITFYENLSDYRLNQQTELNLYRITQEALNNVMKHAAADKIFVQIMLYQTEIIYTFEDNGKGFQIDMVNARKKGMGFSSIHNRVLAMSGTLDIDSSLGGGTSITIQIPNG